METRNKTPAKREIFHCVCAADGTMMLKTFVNKIANRKIKILIFKLVRRRKKDNFFLLPWSRSIKIPKYLQHSF
jgi:hypothetical protein